MLLCKYCISTERHPNKPRVTGFNNFAPSRVINYNNPKENMVIH